MRLKTVVLSGLSGLTALRRGPVNLGGVGTLSAVRLGAGNSG